MQPQCLCGRIGNSLSEGSFDLAYLEIKRAQCLLTGACTQLPNRPARARNPVDNAVISMSVGGIRGINNLDVLHVPEKENQAHSECSLPDDDTLTEIRVLLLRISKMEIPLIPVN